MNLPLGILYHAWQYDHTAKRHVYLDAPPDVGVVVQISSRRALDTERLFGYYS
jgi:hypothetical protein